MARPDRQPIAPASQAILDALAAAQDAQAARQVYMQAESFLQPVLAQSDSGRASSNTRRQPIGKAYSIFLVQLLKGSMARLTSDVVPAMRETLVQLAVIGLEGLAAVRMSLKGRPHEVEVLRYTLVRRLVLLAYFSRALDQSWLIYCALCCQCWQASTEQLACNIEPTSLQCIPYPDVSEDAEVATLVAGTVLNMLLSFSEHKEINKQVSKLLHVSASLKTILAWLK